MVAIHNDPKRPGWGFFSYGNDEERSKVLYSSFKHPLPNIFQGTAFKKHAKLSIKEKQIQKTSKHFSSCHLLQAVKKK